MGVVRMVSWVPVCNRTKRVCLFLSLSSCTVDFLVKAAEFDVGKEGIREYEEHRILLLCLFFVSSSRSSSALKNLLLMFLVFPKLSIFIAVPLWRPLDLLPQPYCLSVTIHPLPISWQYIPSFYSEEICNNQSTVWTSCFSPAPCHLVAKQWGTLTSTHHLGESNCCQILENLLLCPSLAQETIPLFFFF